MNIYSYIYSLLKYRSSPFLRNLQPDTELSKAQRTIHRVTPNLSLAPLARGSEPIPPQRPTERSNLTTLILKNVIINKSDVIKSYEGFDKVVLVETLETCWSTVSYLGFHTQPHNVSTRLLSIYYSCLFPRKLFLYQLSEELVRERKIGRERI